MVEKTDAVSVVSLVGETPTQQQIRAALESDPEFELVAEVDSPEKANKEIRSAMPEIVLVDQRMEGDESVDLIDDLTAQFPEVSMVAILSEEDTLQAQQVMLAGVRAFIIKPFTQVNLLSTLRRVLELETRRRGAHSENDEHEARRSEPVQIMTVYSPRGGVGCSTVAVNLAVALYEQLESRVLLVEGKLLFGHLGLMLNVRPQNTLADLIPHAGAVDPSLIEEVVTEHASGIHLLLAPNDLSVAQGIRPEDLYSVIRGVSQTYDFIVIDAGSFLNENTVTLMDVADRVLLVTTPDLAALHDASRFVQISRTLAFPSDKLLTVLNRAGMPGGVKTRAIASTLHHQLFAQIPEGEASVMHSLNRGVPLVFGTPRSRVSRAIQLLSRKLTADWNGNRAKATASSTKKRGWIRTRLKPANGGKNSFSKDHRTALRMIGR